MAWQRLYLFSPFLWRLSAPTSASWRTISASTTTPSTITTPRRAPAYRARELDRASTELRNYFNNDAAVHLRSRCSRAAARYPLFNDRETQHLHDVKSVFHFVNHVQEIALVYIMAYVVGVFVWARERPLRTLALHTLTGALLTIGRRRLAGRRRRHRLRPGVHAVPPHSLQQQPLGAQPGDRSPDPDVPRRLLVRHDDVPRRADARGGGDPCPRLRRSI